MEKPTPKSRSFLINGLGYAAGAFVGYLCHISVWPPWSRQLAFQSG